MRALMPLAALVLFAAPAQAAVHGHGHGHEVSAAPAEVSAAPAGATWCKVDYDAGQQAIVLAYSGKAPQFTTHADASGFHLEATFDDGAERGFRFGDDLPRRAPFARWNLRRAQGRVTLSVTLQRPLGLLVGEDAERRTAVLAVVGMPEPTMTLPVRLSTVAFPTQAPLKPVMSLAPSVLLAQYQEDYMAGDIQLQTAMIMPGLALGWRLPSPEGPAWQAGLALGTSSLAFRDRVFPLSTHTRQTYAGDVLIGPSFSWGPVSVDGGLGYWVRLEQTVHSAVSPSPTYAFASERWLHGPQLGAAVGWTLLEDASPVGGWRLVAEGTGQPVVFSRLDAGVPPLPGLFGGRVSLGLEGRFAGHQVTVAFQRRMLGSMGGYGEVVQGPTLTFR